MPLLPWHLLPVHQRHAPVCNFHIHLLWKLGLNLPKEKHLRKSRSALTSAYNCFRVATNSIC
nr:MAG TPA: hypothetical protein [Caudoviricetes sp.]DAP20735.1 MAG TPA: hypothetical protein [Caudoviricetes sp.]DAV35299.1 MAG TPA: hypothetical protein [Caudoviricetes sp.]